MAYSEEADANQTFVFQMKEEKKPSLMVLRKVIDWMITL